MFKVCFIFAKAIGLETITHGLRGPTPACSSTYAHLQAAEEEEERRNNRPNYALSEDVTAPQPSSARPGGARRAPLRDLGRTESILSTQSTRRGYDYSLEAAPDAQQARKHLNTFAVSL